MVCAAIGQALGSLVGRHLRQLLVVLGPLRLFFDNVRQTNRTKYRA